MIVPSCNCYKSSQALAQTFVDSDCSYTAIYFHYCINYLGGEPHRPIYHNYYTADRTLHTTHLLLRFPIRYLVRYHRGIESHVITWIPTSRWCMKGPGRFKELLLVHLSPGKFNSTASGELCCYVYRLVLSFSTDLSPCSLYCIPFNNIRI